MKTQLLILFCLLFVLDFLLARAAAADGGDLVLMGGKVYPSPDAQIGNAVVVIHNGKIDLVGKQGKVQGRQSL